MFALKRRSSTVDTRPGSRGVCAVLNAYCVGVSTVLCEAQAVELACNGGSKRATSHTSFARTQNWQGRQFEHSHTYTQFFHCVARCSNADILTLAALLACARARIPHDLAAAASSNS